MPTIRMISGSPSFDPMVPSWRASVFNPHVRSNIDSKRLGGVRQSMAKSHLRQRGQKWGTLLTPAQSESL